jgi:hypothetical protein
VATAIVVRSLLAAFHFPPAHQWVEIAEDMSLDAHGQIAQVRAMVRAGLGTGCRVEMVVTAAVSEG